VKISFSLYRRAFSGSLLIAVWAVMSVVPAMAAGPLRVKLVTSAGDIVLELYPEHAPKTVANFVQYVKDRHYDGTIFHRVIDNFMIQGGGFDGNYVQKKTRAPVAHEGREALTSGGLRNLAGAVAMARTNDPQSATAQFFINVKDNAFLDPSAQSWGYTVFGKVVSGMDVVNKIKIAPTAADGPFPSDVPKTPIVIHKATLEN
jgi:peptidyl-prolyl cis-trans isomerase A (cyclophilin A)